MKVFCQSPALKRIASLTLIAGITLSSLSLPAAAEIEKVFYLDATGVQVTADAAGHYVYIPDQKHQRLLIVDSTTLEEVASIALPGQPQDIALDEQQQRAYVTVEGINQVIVIDLTNNALLDPIALPQPGYEIEVSDYDIFVTTYGNGSGIMRIEKSTYTFFGMFSEGVLTYQRGAIELTPDNSRLIFANRGVSPGTLAVFDITSDSPNLLIKNAHGDLGGNGQAISVDPIAGDFVSYAVGGGNGPGYTIAKLDIDTLSWLGEFNTGAYPRAVHHSLDGHSTYTNNSADEVKVWDNTLMTQSDSFEVNGDPKDFADLQAGALLAVISNEEFAIYQVGDLTQEPQAPKLAGELTGAMAYRTVCINQTTGQRVIIKDTLHEFDCVRAGLNINANDDVRINIRASIEENGRTTTRTHQQ
ncbi:hypothetical protein TDB9533_03777 [Thalassocella blandensis]|nr:hypothetical protein TDB9533_03777 [Thalassocella blandensis]